MDPQRRRRDFLIINRNLIRSKWFSGGDLVGTLVCTGFEINSRIFSLCLRIFLKGNLFLLFCRFATAALENMQKLPDSD